MKRQSQRNVNKQGPVYYVACILLAMWLVYVLYKTMTWWPVPMGESDDYMLLTVSLQYGPDLWVSEEDLRIATLEFPTFGEYLLDNYPEGLSEVADVEKGRLPHYFITYSAVCLPIKILLGKLGLHQMFCFALTNYVLYSMAVVTAFLYTQKPWNMILSWLLAISPVTFYLGWQSAEVFIFSMVALSTMCFMHRKYHMGALLLAVAGTMNITAMAFGFILVGEYLYEEYKKKGGIRKVLFSGKTIGLAVCFLPCFLPMAYYFVTLGRWNLMASAEYQKLAGDMSWFVGRFLSYLFDLNFGMLPYVSIQMCLFVVLVVVSISHKRYRCILWMIGFLAEIGGYSLYNHINCGMSGIARYCAWTLPILFVGITDMVKDIKWSSATRKLISGILGVSLISTGIIINAYGLVFAENTSDINLTPIAKYVIDYHPWAYHQFKWSFVTRVTHRQGVYYYAEPVYYKRDDGCVTKILLSPSDVEEVMEHLVLDWDARKSFDRQVKGKKDLFFLTFSPNDKVQMR